MILVSLSASSSTYNYTHTDYLQQRRGLQSLRARPTRNLPLRYNYSPLRALTSTAQRFQDVFHAQASDPHTSAILSSLKSSSPKIPQTLTEKIVQRYSLGLPKDKFVKAGDYVTLSPHHCMTVS